MTDMVEKIARALCSAAGENPDHVRKFPGATAPQWVGYKIQARTAIRALMEPTEEMHLAGFESPGCSYCDRCMQLGHDRGSGDPILVFKAMLKAALDD